MDGNRFDDLARTLATGASRRSVLRGLTGSIVAVLAAARGVVPAGAAGGKTTVCHRTTSISNPWEQISVGAADLAIHRTHAGDAIAPNFAIDPNHCGRCGRVCPLDQVCEGSRCRAGCRIGGIFVAPGTDRPGNFCQSCQPAANTAEWSAKTNGTSCNDGNACTLTDTCQAGACVGTDPVVCTALDQCHDVGVCNPATGACSNPNKTNGTVCNDNNACTQTDTCFNGTCVGANPVVCTASDQCHVAGICDPMTGTCSNPAAPEGRPCDDGDACTTTECRSGSCTVVGQVGCVASDQCHAVGTCNPATGICSNPLQPDSSPCDDGDACTVGDVCVGGSCRPGSAVDCSAVSTICAEGYCTNGTCATRPRNEGGACSAPGTDPCRPSFCRGGTCTEEPIDCGDPGDCQTAFCVGGSCRTVSAPDGVTCGPSTECSVQICASGSCRSVRANDGNACGVPLNEDCRARVCRDSACVIENLDRGSCPGGVCHAGVCCAGGDSVPGGPCDTANVCCAAPATCCFGGCCENKYCIVGDNSTGDPPLFCCGGSGTTICGDNCCANGSANPDCVTVNGAPRCWRSEMVCKADDGVTDVLCNDACCNGRCCPTGTFCANGTCRPAGVACTTTAECQARGYGNCASVEFEFIFNGPEEPTLQPIANSGTCCVGDRTAQTPDINPPYGPFDYCCDAGYACGMACSDYRNKNCRSGDSICQCSLRITRPRG